ncbi:MAG: O-antigen ligase family protein [Solirubrobacteraceae bacterium]
MVLLLVLATTSQGAFSVSQWAPLALLTLGVLFGALVGRDVVVPRHRPEAALLVGVWGLAAWSLLSMLWANSPGSAWAGSGRTILYAAIITIPFALAIPRRSMAMAGWTIAAGIGLVAYFTLLRMLIDGSPLFLAGRLNAPVGYRNATALLFAVAVWPFLVAAATRAYRRIVRAAALSAATLCLGLAFLTQSRGIVIGLVAGAIVAIGLGPERVRRAWMAILALAAVAIASPWLLRPFHAFDGGHGFVGAHSIAVAAWALAGLSGVSFLVGMAVALLDGGLRSGSLSSRRVHVVARAALVSVAVLALSGALVASGNPVSYLQGKWDQFQSLQDTTPTSTRLVSTGGQRDDLWRVAIKEFRSAPLLGAGTDNYSFGYYRERATNRNLNDPHSLLFALLSENGLVGVGFFLLFLGGLLTMMRSGWAGLDPSARRHIIGPAAAGVVLLGQAIVDWVWLIPGLTAVGLLMLALAAAQVRAGTDLPEHAGGKQPRTGRGSRVPEGLGRAIGIAVLLLATVGVLGLYLSDAYVQRARARTGNPRVELSAARTAAVLDPWSVTPHYLEASAYETQGARQAAFIQLQQALLLEPKNFATLGVLGDFEARGHNFAAARAYYRRALALDPLDSGLQQLAQIGLTGAKRG